MTRPASSPPRAQQRVSVVIVAWGKRPVTERCLAILDDVLGDEIGRRFELVLVDNDSPDDTAELFERRRDRATIVTLPANRNFAGGCNAGARASSGDTLIFLNNDVDVVEGALEALADQVLEPGVGAAGARLLYSGGTLQHAGVGMLGGGEIVVPHHLFHHMDGELPAARATFDIDVVTGACLAIRREVFDRVGEFDEAFANGWEDVDLCLRVRAAGWQIVYRGDIAMVHDEGQTRGNVRGADANATHFYSRWRGLLDPDDALVEETFDGRLPVARRAGADHGARLLLNGPVSAIGPGADEARALLAALEACGLAPAARDLVPSFVEPRLDDKEWADIHAAQRRLPPSGSIELWVPDGVRAVPRPGTVARLAAVPPAGLGGPRAAWTASPAGAAALADAGLGSDRIEILAPPIAAAAVGPGGGGLLVILPTHDLAAAAAALDGLAQLSGAGLRVVPTVATRGIEEMIERRLADAELLPPCSSEHRFASLAAAADAVLCCDPDDRYDRRALVASAAGAAAAAPPGGPAEWILGPDLSPADPYDAAAIRAAATRCLELGAAGREARSQLVHGACGPAATAERLRALVERLGAGSPEPVGV